MRTLMLLVVLLAGCASTSVQPRLPEPPAVPSYAALLREGAVFQEGDLLFGYEPRAYFSVAPETLAALLIRTAGQWGYAVAPVARAPWRAGGTWMVRINQQPVAVFPSGDGSRVHIGTGSLRLPRGLAHPLRLTVTAYLRGELTAAL